MTALWPIAVIVAGVLPLGWLAARAERDEGFARRVAALIAILLLGGLAVSIARGELLRFASWSEEAESADTRDIR